MNAFLWNEMCCSYLEKRGVECVDMVAICLDALAQKLFDRRNLSSMPKVFPVPAINRFSSSHREFLNQMLIEHLL